MKEKSTFREYLAKKYVWENLEKETFFKLEKKNCTKQNIRKNNQKKLFQTAKIDMK